MSDSRPSVIVRTAASSAVGGGHLRRCLSLAQWLRRIGASPRFVLPQLEPPFADWMSSAGFAAQAIDPSARVGQQLQRGEDEAVAWIVADDYALEPEWMEVAAELGPRVAALDDLGGRAVHASLVIDPNESENPRQKHAATLAGGARLLAGCRYALLDPTYETCVSHVVRDDVQSVAIFMGASDPDGASGKVLRACRLVFGGNIEIATTSASPHLDELRELVRGDDKTRISVDLDDLKDFHARHDLQIGSAGGATWERCRVGVPTIAMGVAPNQHAVLPFLRRSGCAVVYEGALSDADSLAAQIGQVIRDAPLRRQLNARARECVDGGGARRVALAMMAHTLTVRQCVSADSMMILSWRNDPTVRAVSNHPDLIDEASHASWFSNALVDPSRLLLMGTVGAVPVGFIRFDRLAAAMVRVSIFLDPALTGLGLGRQLLAMGEAALRNTWPDVRNVSAEVVASNVASLNMFAAAGYDGQAPLLTKSLA